MRDLAGRSAVVTGGGSGIGRGIALGLAEEGMAVADLHAESAEQVAAEIGERGGQAFGVQVDATREDSLAAAAKEIGARVGDVSLLCANAGVLARIASLEAHTVQDWEYTLSVNVLGVVKTVDAFLPALRRNAPEAHIVNTASLGGLFSAEGVPIGAYIASKYACVGYSEVLRAELAAEGIGVSVLCPGVVASSLVTTSSRNRPEAFGEQGAPRFEGIGSEANQPAAPPSALPAEEAGPIVVRAVRANRLHVLTHPAARPVIERRFQGLLDDFDFAAGSPD
jgi:NAD(P)-dependent dehydrogenase (short-subunit alcohol dehydrogenase family)